MGVGAVLAFMNILLLPGSAHDGEHESPEIGDHGSPLLDEPTRATPPSICAEFVSPTGVDLRSSALSNHGLPTHIPTTSVEKLKRLGSVSCHSDDLRGDVTLLLSNLGGTADVIISNSRAQVDQLIADGMLADGEVIFDRGTSGVRVATLPGLGE